MAHLKNLSEYGIECAIKLSILSQNWEKLLDVMISKALAEIEDEQHYKRVKMKMLRDL